MAETCECGNETSCCMNIGEFLDYLKTGYFPDKESAPT